MLRLLSESAVPRIFESLIGTAAAFGRTGRREVVETVSSQKEVAIARGYGVAACEVAERIHVQRSIACPADGIVQAEVVLQSPLFERRQPDPFHEPSLLRGIGRGVGAALPESAEYLERDALDALLRSLSKSRSIRSKRDGCVT